MNPVFCHFYIYSIFVKNTTLYIPEYSTSITENMEEKISFLFFLFFLFFLSSSCTQAPVTSFDHVE